MLTDPPGAAAATPQCLAPESQTPRGRTRSSRVKCAVVRVAVAALLVGYAAMAYTASWRKGVSFDEGMQLAVGYNIWLNHDFRMESANGDLVKRWATLPYLLSRPRFVPSTDSYWKAGRAYDLGWRFFFEVGNRPEALLRASRFMIVLLGMATGWLVYRCARRLFGPIGGLISLTLFVLSPAMLAFGAIVSTDMAITLTLLAATLAVWRVLHELSPIRLLVSLAGVACLVLAKPTALVIFPITAGLVLVNLVAGPPVEVRYGGRRFFIGKRRARLALAAALAVLHIAVGWAAIWAHYEFRYAASPQPEDPTITFYQLTSRDEVSSALKCALDWANRTHFLPQGFLFGVDLLLSSDDHLAAFMNGNWKLGGWRTFFPYAIWVKTPPSLFLLLAIGMGTWWLLRRVRFRSDDATVFCPSLYALGPYVSLIGCYLLVVITKDMNIGHRHVLPIYPALHVLAGATALGLQKWRKPFALVLVPLLAWIAAESWAIRPHYLAYFGPQAGGSSHGYQHLVDSSLGWGMNLPGLKQWLDTHNPSGREPVFLAYFGNDNPDYYGIKAMRLPGFFERRGIEQYPLTPGYYVISASIFQGVYTAAFGPWRNDYEILYRKMFERCAMFSASAASPAQRAELLKKRPLAEWLNDFDLFENLRFARLCAWLRHQGVPPHNIGHSLFIWKLTYADLAAALSGPPVELIDRPAELRRFREFASTDQ
jgi:hypothetical protein